MSNTKYIELLKQYRAGTISESDRHTLEQAALDDAFLFDAMEGYAIHGSSVDNDVIEKLRNKNIKESKVIGFNRKLMGIAASLIALLAITFLVKNSLDSNSHRESIAVAQNTSASADVEPIAQAIPQPENTTTGSSTIDNTTDPADAKVEEEIMEEVANRKLESPQIDDTPVDITRPDKVPPAPPAQVTKDVNPESKRMAEEAAKKEQYDRVEMEPSMNLDDTEEEIIEKTTTNSSGFGVKSKSQNTKPEEDAITYAETEDDGAYILGKILNADGQELMGASVYIENTEIGDVSGLDGNFKLPKYERGHQMVISYTGYKDQKVVIGDLDFYQVVLQPIETLSEVKVTQLKIVGRQNAFPAMGIDEFDTYVRDNLQHPLEVFGSSKSRKVKVGFDVGMNGKLSNFIDQSNNCDECFKEAVRLLKESGRWETKPFGTPYRTSYVFEF